VEVTNANANQGNETMTTATQPVYSWKTTKTTDGYQWTVYSVEYQQPSTYIKTGFASSRYLAVTTAKAWMMYMKRLTK
jgi:hypothetical protein